MSSGSQGLYSGPLAASVRAVNGKSSTARINSGSRSFRVEAILQKSRSLVIHLGDELGPEPHETSQIAA